MPVLEGRVRLGPPERGLAQLESGLGREPDSPASTEEGERVDDLRLDGQLRVERDLGVGSRRFEVQPEAGQQVREGRGRKARLHDRLLVSEVQHRGMGDDGRDRGFGNAHDGIGLHGRGERRERCRHLARRPTAGEREHGVIRPPRRQLRSGEGIGLARTG